MTQQLSYINPCRGLVIKAAVSLWLALCPVLAGAQLIFSGDFDGRLEYMNLRRAVPDSLKNKMVNFLGSAELDLAYSHKKWNLLVSLFSSYTKGTNLYSINVPGELSLTLSQAWVSFLFLKNFSLQAGRIEISYDDERFFQARDWDNLVTSHNAIIAHYLLPDTSTMVDLGFAANRFNANPLVFSTDPAVNSYRYMTYMYAYKRFFDDQLMLSFTDIFDADDNGLSRDILYGRNTLGLSNWLSLSDWDINLAGFYQFGHINDGRRLSSWYCAAYVSYTPTGWLGLMPAFEHLSGDNLADSAEWKHVVHGFSMLYGNMTRSFGKSGLFNSSLRGNLHPGLNNLYFTTTFNILHNFSIETSYHWFSLPHQYIREYQPDSNRYCIVKVPSSFLHQADVLFTYTPVPSLELNLDYELLFPGDGMKNYDGWNFIPGSPVTYAYIELEWTPVFLPHGNKKHSGFRY
jgi:hypothetical protein